MQTPFWEYPTPEGTHPPPLKEAVALVAGHPRLIFRPAGRSAPGRTFEEVRELAAKDATFQQIFAKAAQIEPDKQGPVANAACWIVTSDDRYVEAAIKTMVTQPLDKSNEPYYSSVWSYALAYDWLYHHPLMTAATRAKIEQVILERLQTELAELDQDGMALWHGRNQAANGAMIAALAIGDLPGKTELLQRAAAHYLESLRALKMSGGWPEGASYWIYNRAGPYARAADCFITATGQDKLEDIDIRDVMRVIGFWSLYQYGPNGRFEPYGDSAGSLRLGETGWWELSVDHYARISRDPGLAAGADYLRNRSPDPYGKRPYYWNIVITYDPKVRPSNDYDPEQPELWMRQRLPQAMLFGRGSLNIAYMRGAWGDRNELFASFKAGDMQAHHDHYDVGTFTIQRGGELAARSGFYADYTAQHRLNYYIQTVAANSILVLSPGETSSYLKSKFPERAWLAGGQRVIRPTGFNCVNLVHFEKQLDNGPHLRRAQCLAWRSEPETFDYMSVDITAAYNSTIWSEPGQIAKVSKVTRQFLFLRSEEAFIIFDRVETCDKRYLPKVLLHTITKPITENENVLFGTDENGILASRDRLAVIESGGGRMYQHVLLPAQMRLLKIGGPDYAFYAETDGDQSNGFNGMNLIEGSSRKPGSHGTDGWRIEVEPTDSTGFTTFLQVLVPRLIQGDRRALPPVKLLGETTASVVLRVGATTVEISRSGAALKQSHYQTSGAQGSYLLLDAIPNREYKIGDHTVKSCGEGVLWLP